MGKETKKILIGGVCIGGGSPIAIQSMTNTDTRDIESTLRQIKLLTEAGCEIVRVAVPDMAAAQAVGQIKKQIDIPLVADIHFDYRLALECIKQGVDKLRINPGNIGGAERVAEVVEKAAERQVPIRIGVNGGSLEKDLYQKYGGVTAEALCDSALGHVKILEDLDYDRIVISIKASNVALCVAAYELVSARTNYPLHVGITETGTLYAGQIKSAVGIGAILSRGIGDTVRVSLTGDPVEEVRCAREILKALSLRKFGVEFISCPTCGRTEIDLILLANRVEKFCSGINKPIKVAVMGCAVNGPGEARDADIGVAGGKGYGLIFKKGQILRRVPENQLFDALISEIHALEIDLHEKGRG